MIGGKAAKTIGERVRGTFRSYIINPELFGLKSCRKEELTGGTPAENAEITLSILRGERGHRRDAVLLNAGAGLYLNGKAESLAAGEPPS